MLTAEQQEQPKPFWTEALGESLSSLIDVEIRGEIRDERVALLSKIRRNEYYWQGKNVLARSRLAGNGTHVEWVPAEELYQATTGESSGYEDYNFNFFRGDGHKFISVIGARIPGVKAEADNERDDEAVARCPGAQGLLKFLLKKNRADVRIKEIAEGWWKYGTVFAKTRYRASKRKYGTVSIPQYDTEIRMVETPDGQDLQSYESVVEQEPLEIAKGLAEISIYDGSTISTPFDSSDIEDLPWLLEQSPVHKANFFEEYPEYIDFFREDRGLSLGDGDTGDEERTHALQTSPDHYTQYQRMNRLMVGYLYMKPTMFLLMRNAQHANSLMEEFPEGAMVTLVNGKPVNIEPDNIRKSWVVFKPEFGKSIWADAVGDDFIPAIDLFNDAVNRENNRIDFEAPKTIINTDVIELGTLTRSNVEEFIGMSWGQGTSPDQMFFRMPAANVNPNSMKLPEAALGWGRENAGMHPALWGGGGGPEKTAREAELQNNQALRQMTPLWDSLRYGWGALCDNLVSNYAENAAEDVVTSGGVTWDLTDIAKGGFRFIPEEGMPQTWGQLRDYIMGILNGSEPAQDLLELNNPRNKEKVLEYVGISGLESAGANLNKSVMLTIRKILSVDEQEITPESMAQLAPIDEFLFPALETATIIGDWVRSDAGRMAQAQKPTNWKAVVAWGRMQMNAAMQAQQPQPGQQPGQSGPSPQPGGGQPPQVMAPADIGVLDQAAVNPDMQSLAAMEQQLPPGAA